MKEIGLVVMAACLLVSCAENYNSRAERYYLKSHNGPDLVVPPPLTSANISHFYDLPPQNQNPRVSVRPPAEAVTVGPRHRRTASPT